MRGIKHILSSVFGIFGLLITAGILLGSTYVIQQSTLFPYRSTVAQQDDFITGTTVSGSIGSLGWASAGTITAQSGIANRPGIVRLDTGAVSATIARLTQFGATPWLMSTNHIYNTATRLNTNDANTTVRIGVSDNWTLSPPNNGIYIEKLDADTNWFCVTRSGSVQTRTDSTVAVNTNFNTISYTRNSSGVQFSINNTNVCSVMSSNVPTVAGGFGVFIVNSAAASKTIDVDYLDYTLTGMAR